MRPRRYDIEEIRVGLKLRARELAATLAPGGRVDGFRYWVKSSRPGKVDGSMVIDIAGPTAGRFADFSDEQVKGDALNLIAHFKGVSIAAAIAWAGDWLGLSDAGRRAEIARARAAEPAPSSAEASVEDERRKADLERKAGACQRWFFGAQKLAGTHGADYLRARGIPLDRLDFKPGAIRFAPSMKYKDADASEQFLPGLLTAMTNGAGVVRAVHRTFLDPSRPAKAAVRAPKKMWGDVRGTSIRLSKGENKVTPEEAARLGLCGETLALGEGIEDMLNWSLIFPAHRTAAFGSLSNIRQCPVYPSIETVILVRDNDDNDKTRAAFERAAADFRAAHPAIEHLTAEPVGAKDINELWVA